MRRVFRLEIELENDAYRGNEVQQLSLDLQWLSQTIMNRGTLRRPTKLLDRNGNTVGSYGIEERERGIEDED